MQSPLQSVILKLTTISQMVAFAIAGLMIACSSHNQLPLSAHPTSLNNTASPAEPFAPATLPLNVLTDTLLTRGTADSFATLVKLTIRKTYIRLALIEQWGNRESPFRNGRSSSRPLLIDQMTNGDSSYLSPYFYFLLDKLTIPSERRDVGLVLLVVS